MFLYPEICRNMEYTTSNSAYGHGVNHTRPLYLSNQMGSWIEAASAGLPAIQRPLTSTAAEGAMVIRSLPWRPALNYKIAGISPITTRPIGYSYMDAAQTSHDAYMSPAGSHELKFPSLLQGGAAALNPAQAARTALYTRYTPSDWTHSNYSHFSESDSARGVSERVRADTVRLLRETDDKTVYGQRVAGQKIGERLTDINYWRNELSNELERNIAETHQLMETRRVLERALQDTEGPLGVTQECLYNRENRQGIDLVHDNVEESLLKEVNAIKMCQDRMRKVLEQVNTQLSLNRAARHELERDGGHKDMALRIDQTCHQMHNSSRGIAFHGGIQKMDPTASIPDTWAEFSNRNIQRSQTECAASQRLRSEVDNLITVCANEMWSVWNNSNVSLTTRSTETMDAKSKLQAHLSKVQQEIFDLEKHMELLKKAISDKTAPLQVAQSRLEARTRRPDIELCRDHVHSRLVNEVADITESVDLLKRKLQEAEETHQQLLRTRSRLHHDIGVKSASLFIDRERCLGMRKSFPVVTLVPRV